eukprot:6292920-Amphidinium_carterae.1
MFAGKGEVLPEASANTPAADDPMDSVERKRKGPRRFYMCRLNCGFIEVGCNRTASYSDYYYDYYYSYYHYDDDYYYYYYYYNDADY